MSQYDQIHPNQRPEEAPSRYQKPYEQKFQYNPQPAPAPQPEPEKKRRERRPRRGFWGTVFMLIGILTVLVLLYKYALVPLLVWLGGVMQ